MTGRQIVVDYTDQIVEGLDFEAGSWRKALPTVIEYDWRGDAAPQELATKVRLLWNDKEVVIGYECRYTELDVDDNPEVGVERHALWDRDVCEAFIRSPLEPHAQSYREFEVAPTGQWCDLLVDRSKMWHDWEWQSGMRTLAQIDREDRVWRVVMAIPFLAFGCHPRPGDCWQGNLFRISRLAGERRYLTFSPTRTEVPNFHVATAFVDICFQ
jgi:hypothetical protein